MVPGFEFLVLHTMSSATIKMIWPVCFSTRTRERAREQELHTNTIYVRSRVLMHVVICARAKLRGSTVGDAQAA